MQIDLDAETVDALFPANIVVSSDLCIRHFGQFIRKSFGDVAIGDRLEAHFEIDDPGGVLTGAGADRTARLRLTSRGTRAELSGFVLPCGDGFVLALRIVLGSYYLEDLDLEISDFANDDPVVQALLLFSIQRALIEEQKLIARELAKERQKSLDLLLRISRVSGFIAHDFNNVLSIIKLNCNRMAGRLAHDAEALRIKDIMQTAIARGTSVTRSLMTLSHQNDEAHGGIFVDALIRDNLPFLTAAVGSDAQLTTELDAASLRVSASPVVMLNNLINLLINSRDAMPAGGSISIKTRHLRLAEAGGTRSDGAMRDFLAIEVADTGPGMDESVLARAFEPQFSTKDHGNGLGLASVLDFARGAGGDACIDSEPDGGARVYIYLPGEFMASDTTVAAGMDSAQASSSAALAGRRILIVEDEPFALEALIELLEAEGLLVTGCSSAAGARHALAAERFEILLTDVVMPGDSGAQLARDACRDDPQLKVVLMSGYVPADAELEGHWIFIKKPIDCAALLATLKQLLDTSGE